MTDAYGSLNFFDTKFTRLSFVFYEKSILEIRVIRCCISIVPTSISNCQILWFKLTEFETLVITDFKKVVLCL